MEYYTITVETLDVDKAIQKEVNNGSFLESINTYGDKVYLTFGK